MASAHGYNQMGPHEIIILSTQRESIVRSRDRCKPCPEDEGHLRELGESRSFWFGAEASRHARAVPEVAAKDD